MAITSGQTAIGLTATAIDGASVNSTRMHLHNNDQQQNLFIGGPDVTITTGLVLAKDDHTEITLNPGEQLYGVSSQGGHIVSWLKQTM